MSQRNNRCDPYGGSVKKDVHTEYEPDTGCEMGYNDFAAGIGLLDSDE